MAWRWITLNTELDWNGVRFFVQDCGSDGNCLFRSLAFVFKLAGYDANHGQLRDIAVDRLIDWYFNLPNWFDAHNYEVPTELSIGNLASGDWGDLTSMLAILNSYQVLRIHLLNASISPRLAHESYAIQIPDPVLQHSHLAIAQNVYIMFVGGNHYVALIPADALAENVRAAAASLVELPQASNSTSASVKVSTVSGLSKKLNTLSQNEASLEIHQIDVGIGDCTLIQVKGADGTYKLSVLVDSGRFSEQVTGYLDNLISLNRFRTIDYFIATHYDGDHIGAAPAVLSNIKYVSNALMLYDVGERAGDRDYANYKKAFGEANQGRRNLPDLEQPLATVEGVEIKIVAMNGCYRSTQRGYCKSVQEAYCMEEIPISFLKGTATQTEWVSEGWSPGALFPNDPNDSSLAVLATFGNFRFYTAGDLNGDAEDAIATHIFHTALGGAGHICACKLNHHGAHESTSPGILKLLRPRMCLVSCGTPNVFGHPSEITEARIAQLNAVYPCNALVTANLDCSFTQKGIPWVRPAKDSPVAHNQGSIVLIATASMAAKNDHAFLVMTTRSPEPRPIKCGARAYDPNLAIVDAKSKMPLSDQQKADKKQRRLSRKETATQDAKRKQIKFKDALKNALDAVIDQQQPNAFLAKEYHEELDDTLLTELAQKFFREEKSAQQSAIRTLCKNLGKNFASFNRGKDMTNWLKRQRR